jgi:hypothetical protein
LTISDLARGLAATFMIAASVVPAIASDDAHAACKARMKADAAITRASNEAVHEDGVRAGHSEWCGQASKIINAIVDEIATAHNCNVRPALIENMETALQKMRQRSEGCSR